jgi:hypothetical protein
MYARTVSTSYYWASVSAAQCQYDNTAPAATTQLHQIFCLDGSGNVITSSQSLNVCCASRIGLLSHRRTHRRIRDPPRWRHTSSSHLCLSIQYVNARQLICFSQFYRAITVTHISSVIVSTCSVVLIYVIFQWRITVSALVCSAYEQFVDCSDIWRSCFEL